MRKQKNNMRWCMLTCLIVTGLMSCRMGKEMRGREVLEPTVIEGKDEMDKRRMAVEHFREAGNYFRNGELVKAKDEVKIAIALDPNHPVPHLLLGDIYYAEKDFQKAMHEYRRAKAIDGTKGLPHAKIGKVYMELGMNEKALEAYRTAVQLDPDIPVLHRELGDLYRQMGLEEEAQREYRKAEESKISDTKKSRVRKPSDPRVKRVLKLGDEFLKDGLLALAIEEFKIAVKLDPNSPITNQKLGDAYVRKGMLEEAIGQYERVRDLKPDLPLSYLGLGIAHARMYEIEKAISFFEKGISLDPHFAPLHFELAMAYLKADRLDEAISELEKTVELDTVNPQPKGLLAAVKKEKEAEKGFVTIQSGPFMLKYDPGQDQAFIDDILRMLQESYQKLVIDVDYRPKEGIIVKLYGDLKQFHLATSTPEWFRGGVAATKDYRILLATPKREVNLNRLPEVITHELTHVFTNLITYGNHPAWIHEGIALYEAGQWDLEKERILRQAIREDKLLRLDELERPFPGFKNPRRINLAYAQSYTAAKFILDHYGRESFLEILSQFSKGRDFDEAARHVLGMEMKEFEEGWLDFVRKIYG